ncbi:patatin-like phospholipase family protein [Diaphorobacter aerolatus]|uniref:Patatin-like phospholipase family protein n=1 Tax=Diaphorobacter aerolatus TaxID=1288495 RepID=A0A7H0GN61_9BURK|nr:patatin-like phospholipase family protein [Diaphorobacter aerolatus]QNP49727.1 patatin-like phospholipase family protein [Diaphorobacter aerolatus]
MPEERREKTLNLALQGGGSHGAYTWGVLDALLEDGRVRIEGVSGTSAGAMNAVALAHGFAMAAHEYKDPHEKQLAGAQKARESLTRLWEGVGTMGSTMLWGVPMPAAGAFMNMLSQWLSPYQMNPLGINPLRKLLEKEVDFERIGATNAKQVFVCATNVRTGRGEIFTGKRLSADAVMASACLPMLFKAVEIDGEHYWDGGYSGNPAIYPLIYRTDASDILLVQINPIDHDRLPDDAQEIMERVNEVTFNAGLLAELRAIEFVRRLLAEGKLDSRRYKNVLMHRIDGGSVLAPMGAASKMRTDMSFIRQLFALGRASGEEWLKKHFADIGLKPTLKLAENM